MEKPTTPTLDKVSELRPQMQAIGEFLEWLTGQGYVLGGHQYHYQDCKVHDFGEPMAEEDSEDDRTRRSWRRAKAVCRCDEVAAECFGLVEDCPWPHVDWLWRMPIRDRSESTNHMLARYFEVDQQEMQAEQGRILEWVRNGMV